MISFGLTSASFSCTHFQDSELFQAFLSAVHSLVWFFGPSPQYSRDASHPECLRRSYIVVPPVLGMCTKYSSPHSMSTAHLHTDCAVLGQPFAHVVVHQSSVAMALMAAYPCLHTSAPSAVGATEASATLVGTGDGVAGGGGRHLLGRRLLGRRPLRRCLLRRRLHRRHLLPRRHLLLRRCRRRLLRRRHLLRRRLLRRRLHRRHLFRQLLLRRRLLRRHRRVHGVVFRRVRGVHGVGCRHGRVSRLVGCCDSRVGRNLCRLVMSFHSRVSRNKRHLVGGH